MKCRQTRRQTRQHAILQAGGKRETENMKNMRGNGKYEKETVIDKHFYFQR